MATPLFKKLTALIIQNLEGGYYHPDMLKDGRIKDTRYAASGETMFGIDRLQGGVINTSDAGKQFWNIIDRANARSLWHWLYRGGDKEQILMDLCADMMQPQFDQYCKLYLTPAAIALILSDPRLLFNFAYACWNGPGWFELFAGIINKAINGGVADREQLVRIALKARTDTQNSLIMQGATKIATLFNSDAFKAALAA